MVGETCSILCSTLLSGSLSTLSCRSTSGRCVVMGEGFLGGGSICVCADGGRVVWLEQAARYRGRPCLSGVSVNCVFSEEGTHT